MTKTTSLYQVREFIGNSYSKQLGRHLRGLIHGLQRRRGSNWRGGQFRGHERGGGVLRVFVLSSRLGEGEVSSASALADEALLDGERHLGDDLEFGFREQVERMLRDPKAIAALDRLADKHGGVTAAVTFALHAATAKRAASPH